MTDPLVALGDAWIVDRGNLPKRRPHESYYTPEWLCDRAVGVIEGSPRCIVDPGAGGGAFGRAAIKKWPNARLVGVDTNEDLVNPGYYHRWLPLDFVGSAINTETGYVQTQEGVVRIRPDLIIGNPPYNQAEAFVRRSLEWLPFGGQVLFLLRLAFLEGQRRRDGLFKENPVHLVHVCSRRPSFNEDGKGTNATAFALFHWRKDWQGDSQVRWL